MYYALYLKYIFFYFMKELIVTLTTVISSQGLRKLGTKFSKLFELK